MFSSANVRATNDLASPPAGCYWARIDCVKAPCNEQPYQLICPTPTPSPIPSPTPSPKPSPTPAHKSSCDALEVTGGNNQNVPTKVTLLAKASDNKGNIQKYQFYFGDGEKVETPDREVTHEYDASGRFMATVYVQDSTGKWITSNRCEARVTVKPSSVESHKADCSDLFLTVDNSGRAPATVSARVTGYDNKGDIKQYKVDFGQGAEQKSDDNTLDHRYDTAGTYTVRAYIKDSKDTWHGGDEACKKTITISGAAMTQQPKTGTATWFTLSGVAASVSGVGTWIIRKRSLLG